MPLKLDLAPYPLSILQFTCKRPRRPILFTLQYNLVFASYPLTVYPNQYFNVLVNTATASTSPGTATLQLICSGSTVQSWSISINQTANLQLSDTATTQSSCNFQVVPGSTYTGVSTASNVQIALVPVIISKPATSSVPVYQPASIPIYVESTAVPDAIGNVPHDPFLLLQCSVLLQCSSQY